LIYFPHNNICPSIIYYANHLLLRLQNPPKSSQWPVPPISETSTWNVHQLRSLEPLLKQPHLIRYHRHRQIQATPSAIDIVQVTVLLFIQNQFNRFHIYDHLNSLSRHNINKGSLSSIHELGNPKKILDI
jgi:hypothetical protein